MPTYDYKCPKCDALKEVQHSINDLGKITVSCSSCNHSMEKVISLCSVNMDCPGFYASENRR